MLAAFMASASTDTETSQAQWETVTAATHLAAFRPIQDSARVHSLAPVDSLAPVTVPEPEPELDIDCEAEHDIDSRPGRYIAALTLLVIIASYIRTRR